MEKEVALFTSIGLSEQKAKETLKNENLTANLKEVIEEANVHCPKGISKNVGNLLYTLASKIKNQIRPNLKVVAKYVAEEHINSEVRLNAALEYLLNQPDANLNVKAFEESFGKGVTVSPQQLSAMVTEIMESNKEELLAKRYMFNVGMLMTEIRKRVKWVDGKAVKDEVDAQVLKLLGPKSAADDAAAKNKKQAAPKPSAAAAPAKKESAEEAEPVVTIHDIMKNLPLHKPGQNYTADGYVTTPLTKQLIEEHFKITGGKVRTRFPPEPNGILHIGHAKAININFGYAKAHGGDCFLRFDDTNPEKEEEKFFVGIKEIIGWLGYKPYKVTHSSDYFDQQYELARKLISLDHAYVCHQKTEDIKGFNPPPSPWRDRPIEESLRLFEDMKNGKIDEGEATMRMKITLEEGKVDPVAYRIKFVHHTRTGNKWCIYPTYDFTHCLCDSIENITHSLCTKEFQSRRSSYYWLCNVLGVYCPVQWEYGRLNVNYTVVSKRKIAKLITEAIVRDWDDPRLFTLTALRRRGFPSEAINNFCAKMGVTTAQAVVDPHMLEACVRDVLNETAPRVMAVLEPLKISISNFPPGGTIQVPVPEFPQAPERGSHTVPFDKILYIDRTDFRENEEEGFRRLTPKQPVGLRHAGYVISVESLVKDNTGKVIEVKAKCTATGDGPKPKAFIQWVSNPLPCEVRLYDRLFLHKNPEDPAEVPGGFLSDINPNNLTVISDALVDRSAAKAKALDKFQFERIGFFSVDYDSNDNKLVFNRTVLLKEDAGKK